MTSSANDEWNYFHLRMGIEQLEKDIRKIRHLAVDKLAAEDTVVCLLDTIRFIEYNMRELEITGGNGDE